MVRHAPPSRLRRTAGWLAAGAFVLSPLLALGGFAADPACDPTDDDIDVVAPVSASKSSGPRVKPAGPDALTVETRALDHVHWAGVDLGAVAAPCVAVPALKAHAERGPPLSR